MILTILTKESPFEELINIYGSVVNTESYEGVQDRDIDIIIKSMSLYSNEMINNITNSEIFNDYSKFNYKDSIETMLSIINEYINSYYLSLTVN